MTNTQAVRARRTTWTYRGIEITLYSTGWYSAFVAGYGFLKADTLTGARELIRHYLASVSS